MIRVLFVCLGNICRSPMAEGVFRHLVEQEGLAGHFAIESVGTGAWHIGEPPHRGTQRELRARGVDLSGKRSRQVTTGDVETSDYVIAMDRSNLHNLQRHDPNGQLDGKAHLLLDFADGVDARDVPDPYYEGKFDRVYNLVEAGCHGLLDYIREEEEI
ncbi:MAG: Low molecular weight protein-tyrosine-phosphatase YfkJ [Anaerolineales bacterium]|nr:Low molecular weight protein-tyrosine-phosphatase YfkJ [Anaerolineales bacterium]